MLPTKIVVIGAGSASFGLNTLAALMRSTRLRGSRLALVDQNPQTLEVVHSLAQRLNREWDTRMQLSTHTHHRQALAGAEFVVSAIEVPPREKLWRMDFEIPLRFGVRQPYAENGGPGGFAHAARNITPVMAIVRDMEEMCPRAWFINFTNPMVRICDVISRYSRIQVVGLCHQIFAGYGMAGYLLAPELGIELPEGPISTYADPRFWGAIKHITAQAVERIDIKAAGLNHFTWIMDIRDRRSGENLYPLLRERAVMLAHIEPLTLKVFEAFGLFPVPGDTHLCEYLPWASDAQTRPWEKFNLRLYDWERAERSRDDGLQLIQRMGQGAAPVEELKGATSEGAVEIIENVAGAGTHYAIAVNRPNIGQISGLPQGAVVETPALVSGAGVQPVAVGALPEGITELLQREIRCGQLGVDAVMQGSRQLALQCLLLDPVITDLDVAEQVLDAYLEAYRDYLPTFWQ